MCSSCATGIGLTLNNVQYTNNSVVTITDIGTGRAALLCTTTYRYCCSSAYPETQWYFPNGTQVQNLGFSPPSMTFSRTRSRYPAAVRLNRNPGATTTGIFHCDILDASGDLQSLYVGIYTATRGESCTLKSNKFVYLWGEPQAAYYCDVQRIVNSKQSIIALQMLEHNFFTWMSKNSGCKCTASIKV